MRWPLISSLSHGLWCGTIVIALTYAQSGAHAQTSGPIPNGGPAPANSSSSVSSPGSTSADLPDSPGAVLRRRLQAPDESSETASVSDAAVAQDQTAGSQPPGSSSAAPSSIPRASGASSSGSNSPGLTGAEAKASDTRRLGNCLADPRAAGSGIVESRTDSPGAMNAAGATSGASVSTRPPAGCPPAQNPFQRFLNSGTVIPLTPRQKAHLAVHNFVDPGNIVTILGTSGIAIASDSHTAYGPGWRGFGRNAGLSFVQDATGDFFGTFLIPSVAHEDPHYHRMPNASIPMRTLHAISRTVIAQGDDGHAMPNYATLLTYPITAEIANLYVPGVATNGPSTAERVLIGYATDPIDNLITEFLPDLAKRVHVRVIFVQQIVNQVAAGQPVSMF